jgi:hypothetical protein
MLFWVITFCSLGIACCLPLLVSVKNAVYEWICVFRFSVYLVELVETWGKSTEWVIYSLTMVKIIAVSISVMICV